MKKLGIVILGLFLLISCVGITPVEILKPPRQVSNSDYTLLELGECRKEESSFTFCNIAEAIHPKFGHVLQWLDTDYQTNGVDGKCDLAFLFLANDDGTFSIVQQYITCDEATEQILRANLPESGYPLEDHYKESKLFKGESLLKKD